MHRLRPQELENDDNAMEQEKTICHDTIKIWCRFGIHRYGKWVDVQGGEVTTKHNKTVGYFGIQQKRCISCNKVKFKRIIKII